MALTKLKGDQGELKVAADIMARGYRVAFPFGEDWPYDMIILRNGKLERVQVKYVESDGEVVKASCRTSYTGGITYFTQDNIDWLAVYDKTSDRCYYIPSSELGEQRTQVNLRLLPSKNNQSKGVKAAQDYLRL